MENSVVLFGSTDAELSPRVPSLLQLNDDCLIEIFKRLELLDFVNLSKTCVRLKNVAGNSFVQKFKSVAINDFCDEYYSERNATVKVTKRQFCNVLSVIGWRVLSIEIDEGDEFIVRAVTSKCKNVNSLSLLYSECSLNECPQLQEFTNLKELQIYKCEISKRTLRQIFINNPDIERLKYDWAYKGLVKLLRLLPKLKRLSLAVIETSLAVNEVPNLFHLKNVTDFQFGSFTNCNKFIIELATKWQLVKLDFYSEFDEKTFGSLKLFEKLEHLKMGSTRSCNLPEHTVFPSNLHSIHFLNICFTHRMLASIVNVLKLLERIHLTGRYMTRDPRELFPTS